MRVFPGRCPWAVMKLGRWPVENGREGEWEKNAEDGREFQISRSQISDHDRGRKREASLSRNGPFKMAVKKLKSACAVDGVRAVENLDCGAIADA